MALITEVTDLVEALADVAFRLCLQQGVDACNTQTRTAGSKHPPKTPKPRFAQDCKPDPLPRKGRK